MAGLYTSPTAVSISVGKSVLRGRLWKGGAQLVLAFHGYSNSSARFDGLAQTLLAHFTTLALDLPGHGDTKWAAGEVLDNAALRSIITQLCTEQDVEKLSLVGYSLGGRVALSALVAVPEKVRSLTLLAPDGLRTHPILSYVNDSAAGDFLLNDVHQNPARYGKLLSLLRRQKVFSENQYQFFQYHLSNASSNAMLRTSWQALKKLYPKPDLLRKIFAEDPVPVHLFMGVHDPVIPLRNGEYFAGLFPQNVQLHKLQKGHRLLIDDVYPAILKTLLHP